MRKSILASAAMMGLLSSVAFANPAAERVKEVEQKGERATEKESVRASTKESKSNNVGSESVRENVMQGSSAVVKGGTTTGTTYAAPTSEAQKAQILATQKAVTNEDVALQLFDLAVIAGNASAKEDLNNSAMGVSKAALMKLISKEEAAQMIAANIAIYKNIGEPFLSKGAFHECKKLTTNSFQALKGLIVKAEGASVNGKAAVRNASLEGLQAIHGSSEGALAALNGLTNSEGTCDLVNPRAVN